MKMRKVLIFSLVVGLTLVGCNQGKEQTDKNVETIISSEAKNVQENSTENDAKNMQEKNTENDVKNVKENNTEKDGGNSKITDSFDERLIGYWYCVSDTSNGEEGYFPYEIGILPDGTLYLDEYYTDSLNKKWGKVVTNGNFINFLEILIEYMDEGTIDISEIETTYEFKDAMEPQSYSNHSPKNMYEVNGDDLLVIHAIGKYNVSPLEIQDIDECLVLERAYDMPKEYVCPYLLGVWNDSLGNTWNFWYDEKGEFCFALVDSDKKVYSGSSLYTDVTLDQSVELTVYFDDISVPKYSIVSCDSNKLVLKYDNKDLVLTRQNGVEVDETIKNQK